MVSKKQEIKHHRTFWQVDGSLLGTLIYEWHSVDNDNQSSVVLRSNDAWEELRDTDKSFCLFICVPCSFGVIQGHHTFKLETWLLEEGTPH